MRSVKNKEKRNNMNVMQMLEQSAILTLLGMTIVFAFLWIMVLCVAGVGKIVRALGLDKDIQPPKAEPENVNNAVPAVIMAAITEYKKREQDSR
jgi:sodium pump decarboxylase gamma subunit